ncbi:MAG: purine nucleoside permease [Pseudomonadota bacterium]
MAARLAPILCALLLSLFGCATQSGEPTERPDAQRSCTLAGCAAPYEIRAVVLAMWEVGEVEGDSPGEFQLWKSRQGLDRRLPFPHGEFDLYLNEKTGVLGAVTGVGTAKSAATVMALGLDPRFDLRNAYWLVAGVAGIDPEDASIGSAAWSTYLIDGDLGHEIDAREIPADWSTGFFPLRTPGPYPDERPASRGELFKINDGLRNWAFELTQDTALPDSPALEQARSRYTEHPRAQLPPFVLKGGHMAAMTYWHGALMNRWANDYVRYWSDGATDMVTSAMEDTGSYLAIERLHRLGRVDQSRFMVLRAGSNYTMPPPGISAIENLRSEQSGYTAMIASLEALYRVGSRVLDELTGNWSRYRDRVPSAL